MAENLENYIKEEKKNFEDILSQESLEILLIEDNPGDIRLIREMLIEASNDKFNFTIKENLKDGIDSLLNNGFKIILLDLSLPDSLGLDSLNRILKVKPKIPIIVLTGTNDQIIAVNAVKSGAQDYLVKGMVNKTLLERSIYYAIERYRIQTELFDSELRYREAFNRAEFFKDLFAHDMNNILQSILSATQLCDIFLTKGINSTDLKKCLSYVKDVRRGAKLISNVRKISQLQQKQVIFKTIDVLNLLDRVIMNIKKEFSNRIIIAKIETFSDNVKIRANNYLEDVFDNILVNAVVHNINSIIEIEIKISEEKIENINYLKIQTIDNGIGIEDSRKKIIFNRGFKEDKSIFGMGLGLSLVSMIIIEIYHGRIWIENKIQRDFSKGSNFVILIPEVKKE